MKKKFVIITILIVFLLTICSYFMCGKNKLKNFSYKNLRIAPYLNLVDEYARKNKLIEKKYILTNIELLRNKSVEKMLLEGYGYNFNKKDGILGFILIRLCSTQAEYGDIILLADYKKYRIIKELSFKPEQNCLKIRNEKFQKTVKITTSFRKMLSFLINKEKKKLTEENYNKLVNSVKGIVLYDRRNQNFHCDFVDNYLKLGDYNGNFILVDVSGKPTWKDLNDSMLGGIFYLCYDASTRKFIKSYVLR
ncbi:hypothetical protein AAEX28_15625 [Lentisphaerota bacterium WC36G]|nr:hypothetical protein LJT99_02385 [Lentisphaerae bacterium WC36]